LHIVVCIKQTPVVAEARLDPETKTIVREGVTLTLNTFDRRALVEALRLRGDLGGSVTVITMGPPQARDALVECLGIGADRAIHLTDRAFAGADTLATSRTLAMALRKLQPDLVLCGKFSVDAETGQVPPEIAEFLDLPQVTAIRKIRPGDEPNTLWVERETDEGCEHWQVSLPAVLSVTEWIILPRRASPEDMAAAAGKPLEEWHAGDLESDPSVFGVAGSPTTVAGFRAGQLEREGVVVSGEDPEAAAQQAAEFVAEGGDVEAGVVGDQDGVFELLEESLGHLRESRRPAKLGLADAGQVAHPGGEGAVGIEQLAPLLGDATVFDAADTDFDDALVAADVVGGLQIQDEEVAALPPDFLGVRLGPLNPVLRGQPQVGVIVDEFLDQGACQLGRCCSEEEELPADLLR